MASTLTPTTFKVKIREEHVVRNISTLNENVYKIKNVTNVDRRTVTCPETASIDLININGVNPGVSGSNFNGSFDSSLEAVKVYAISSSIDVEYVIVNA
jgi:hypothetical protein